MSRELSSLSGKCEGCCLELLRFPVCCGQALFKAPRIGWYPQITDPYDCWISILFTKWPNWHLHDDPWIISVSCSVSGPNPLSRAVTLLPSTWGVLDISVNILLAIEVITFLCFGKRPNVKHNLTFNWRKQLCLIFYSALLTSCFCRYQHSNRNNNMLLCKFVPVVRRLV